MSAITDDLSRIGIAPTPALAAFDALELEIRRVRSEDAPDTRRRFRALVAAGAPSAELTAAYDAAVTAAMRSAAAGAVLAEVEVPMRQGLKRALKADADALWSLVAQRFAGIVADLAPVIAVLGPNPDQAAVRGLGPAAQQAMRTYLAAISVIGNMVGVVRELAAVRGERTPLPMTRYVDPDELQRLADVIRANACQGGAGYGIAALIAAGFTPKLNTAAEHATAIARVRAAEDAAQAERGGAKAAPAPAADESEQPVRRIR